FESDARTTTLTHSIDGRGGSIHRRGGDFGIGSPVWRATALWLIYFSSSFLCNSIDLLSLSVDLRDLLTIGGTRKANP
ncbi:hypothetical protein A2U01_0071662, partial [Trifolium medium]|nr:hypothetical protein [Trifolium medium]